MATSREDLIGSDAMEDSEPKVSEDLNCPLCLKVFRSPRRLPCSHSFCQDCLQSHISNSASVKDTITEFYCPICETVVRSGDETSLDKWVYSFPFNTLLLFLLMKSKVKANFLCNICQLDDVISPAEYYCAFCEEVLCANCSRVQRNQRVSKLHIILKIEDLQIKPDIVLQHNHVFICMKHVGTPLELYCETHETPLCFICFCAHHSKCSDVVDLTNATLNPSENISHIKVRMKELEQQLKTFIDVNVSNLTHLETQVDDMTAEIRALKKSINDVLDDLESRVQLEGDKIQKEERKRTEQIIDGCQSHITAIRNAHVILESVYKCTTQTKTFLLAKNIMNQLSLSKAKIEEKYSKTDKLTLHLEINPLLKSVFSISRCDIAKLKMKRNDGDMILSDGFKALKDYRAEIVYTADVNCLYDKVPWYSDVTYLTDDQVVLVDIGNNRCCLFNSSTNYTTTCVLPPSPSKICVVRESEVAISIPEQKYIQFLSVKDNTITPTRKMTTRNKCYGISCVSQKEMIVSGPCGDDKTYYWSLITMEGVEKSYHEFDGKRSLQTYVALNTLKTRLYISVWGDNSFICFGMDGIKYFTFYHRDLKQPQGVAVDRDDNVYVLGSNSHNVLQLSPDGSLIQILVKDIEKKPIGICFDQNGDKFMLTCFQDTTLSVYALKNNDG